MKEDIDCETIKNLEHHIKGKIIKTVRLENKYQDFLVIGFEDGATLKIEYDWLYGYKIEG